MKAWLNKLLYKACSIVPLASFRIFFGLATFISTLRFIMLGWIDLHFVDTHVQFKYFGFEWVSLLPPVYMYVLHIILLLSSLGILFGAWYRISIITFFIGFTYCELIDLTYYLNHYYFVSLVAFLLIFLPAHRNYSLDVKWGRVKPLEQIPAYPILLLKFQLLLVYFFAGIAKINYDWLMLAMPLKIWLPANSDMPLLGPMFTYEFTAYVFSWVGMLFDITIGYFLFKKTTRFYAWLVVVFFHLLTGYLFQIGVFPLVMIVSTLIFFGEKFHLNVLSWFSKIIQFKANKIRFEPTLTSTKSIWITAAILVWVSFHIAFPFRYLGYPGNFFWTEQGYRFGWRVMLFEKAGTATFYVKDDTTSKEGVVDNRDFLNPHQEKQMAMQPDMILQYAQFLKRHYEERGLVVNNVRAEVYVTINGRASQLLFNPEQNLLVLKDSWQHKDWIKPFEN